MATIIRNDSWLLFISKYESVNIEINKSKVGVLLENKLFRRDIFFIRIGNK